MTTVTVIYFSTLRGYIKEYKGVGEGERVRERKRGTRKGRYNAGLSRESTFLDTSPLSYCPPPNARTKDSEEKKFNSAFKLFPPPSLVPPSILVLRPATHHPHPRNAACCVVRRPFYIEQRGFETDDEDFLEICNTWKIVNVLQLLYLLQNFCLYCFDENTSFYGYKW